MTILEVRTGTDSRHAHLTLSTWKKFSELTNDASNSVRIDGASLTTADVVAVARYA